MPRPPSLLYASLTICESLVEDKDDIFSLIRLIDVFRVTMSAESHQRITGEGQTYFIPITLLVQAKFDAQDTGNHSFSLALMRPDGETAEPLESMDMALANVQAPDQNFLWRTVNIRANMNVKPRQFGRHWFILLVDGDEVTRTPFALLEPSLNAEA